MTICVRVACAAVAGVVHAFAAAAWAQASPTATPAPTVTPTATVRCVDAAPSNPCIPGGGSATSDCNLEWAVMPVPTLTRNGIPKRTSICYEGDPRCDIDPDLTNKSCTFDPRLCINNSDPRLADCVASGIATFEVKKPNPASTDTADMANLAVLENHAGNGPDGFGLTVVRKQTPVSSGTPNPTPNLCSGPIDLVAPLRETTSGALKRHAKTVRIQATTSLDVRDSDTLKIECRPSTCGNGTIEDGHEDCDDGNRADGDGCDRGCHLEQFGVIASGQSIAQPEVVTLVEDSLGCAWVRVNIKLNGDPNSYQNFGLFLEAGVNVVVTFSYRNPANVDTTYGSPTDPEWSGAGFPFVSKSQFQSDLRDALTPVLSALNSGRVWVQCENEVSDASLNPDARYWRGTDDQYLTQLRAFYDEVRSINRSVPVVMTSFASESLSALIDENDQMHDYQVTRTTRLLTDGRYDAVDLHFYGCVEDIAPKAQWVKGGMPAGRRWISTENGGPDYRCLSTPIHYGDPDFEDVEAQQVSARLSACADNGGTACLWFSLFDLVNSPEPFAHLGLLDQTFTPPRQKPAYFAFQSFVASHR